MPAPPRSHRVALRVAGMTAPPLDRAALRDRVAGQVVLVTGASRGIGAATARRLAGAGARTVLLARDPEALEAVAQDIRRRGGTARVLPSDLRDVEAARRAGLDVLDREGTPALVVSGAGHSIRRPLLDSTERFHDVARLAGVNHLGPVAMLLPLLAAMARERTGHVVTLSSVSALVPAPGWSAYGSSKAAHDAWWRAVRPELARVGVAASTLYLPLVHTAMSAPTGAGRLGMSVDAAADRVCDVVLRRPHRWSPWWVPLAAHVALAAPRAVTPWVPPC